jgi:hypothetical protein
LATQGALPALLTPVANLLPASLAPAENFPPMAIKLTAFYTTQKARKSVL